MILDKEVQIRATGSNASYYESLGYKIPKVIGKRGKPIYDKTKMFNVKIKDLRKGSNLLVNVSCDVCGKENKTPYCTYLHLLEESKIYMCRKCAYEKGRKTCLIKYGSENPMGNNFVRNKAKETILSRYGVDNVFKSDEIKEKIRNTNMKKYGVENPKSCDFIKEKAKETLLNNYGVENPMYSQQIRNRQIQTNIEKYGVEYTQSSREIHQKSVDTFLKKYGVDNPAKVPYFQEKMKTSLYKNNTCQTSIQQKYICSLYNGKLNYPFKKYNFDILIDDNIDVEYDGGGHNLHVKIGNMTEKEFKQKEIVRNNCIKHYGYLCIRLISSTDKLPSDEVLLKILSLSKEYFNTTNHTWIEWYFDENKFRNADNIEGTFYDFGKLRRISAKYIGM